MYVIVGRKLMLVTLESELRFNQYSDLPEENQSIIQEDCNTWPGLFYS